jgi:hypothetical protein
MTTVPIWQHIVVTLALLCSNAVTFKLFERRVRDLQAALVAKNVLLGVDRKTSATIVAGGTMVLTVKDYVGRIRLWSKSHANIRLEFEDA